MPTDEALLIAEILVLVNQDVERCGLRCVEVLANFQTPPAEPCSRRYVMF